MCFGLRGRGDPYTVTQENYADAGDYGAVAQQLKQLPSLLRRYRKERNALYGSMKNKALFKRAEQLGYRRITLMFPKQEPDGGAGIPPDLLQLGWQARYFLDLAIKVEFLMELQEKLAAPRRAAIKLL